MLGREGGDPQDGREEHLGSLFQSTTPKLGPGRFSSLSCSCTPITGLIQVPSKNHLGIPTIQEKGSVRDDGVRAEEAKS